jgi:hypothetical protein
MRYATHVGKDQAKSIRDGLIEFIHETYFKG